MNWLIPTHTQGQCTMSDHTKGLIAGTIVGYDPGIIWVQADNGKTICLDRFSAASPLDNGFALFRLPGPNQSHVTVPRTLLEAYYNLLLSARALLMDLEETPEHMDPHYATINTDHVHNIQSACNHITDESKPK